MRLRFLLLPLLTDVCPRTHPSDLGRRSIYHATHRDAYSGGINNLYHVTKDGWKVVHAIDVNDMHYEFQEEKKAAMS